MADKEKKDHYLITGLFVSKCKDFEANNGRKPKFGEKLTIAKDILAKNKIHATFRAILLAAGIGIGAASLGAGTQPTEESIKIEQEGQAPSQETVENTQENIQQQVVDGITENETPVVEYHDSSSGQFFEPGEQKQALRDMYQFMKDNGILNENASIEPEDYKMYASKSAQLSIIDVDGNGIYDENIDKIISSYNMGDNTVDYGTNAPENAIPFQYNGYVISIVNPNTNEVIASMLHGEPTTFNFTNIESMGHYQNVETKGAILGDTVLKGAAKQFDAKEYSNLAGPFDRIWKAELMEVNERLEKQGQGKIIEPVLGQQKLTPTNDSQTTITQDTIAGLGTQQEEVTQTVVGVREENPTNTTQNNNTPKTTEDDEYER